MNRSRLTSLLKDIIEPKRELVYFFLVAFLPLITLVLAWGGSTCATVQQGFFSRDLRCVIAEPLLFGFFVLTAIILAYLFSGLLTYYLKNPIERWCRNYRIAELIFRPGNLALFFILYITTAYTFYALEMFVIARSNGVDLLLFGLAVFFLPTALLYITVLATYGLWVDLTGVEIQFLDSLPIPIQIGLATMLFIGSLLLGVAWFPLLARGFEKATLWIYSKLSRLVRYLSKNRKARNRALVTAGVMLAAILLAGTGIAYMNVNVPLGNHIGTTKTADVPSLPARANLTNQTIVSYLEDYHEAKVRNSIINGSPDWLNQLYEKGYHLKSAKVSCNPTVVSRMGVGNNTSVTLHQNCSWGFVLVGTWGSNEKYYNFTDNETYVVSRECQTYITLEGVQPHSECSWVTERESGERS